MERIPFEQLRAEFERVLLEAGVPGPKADSAPWAPSNNGTETEA